MFSPVFFIVPPEWKTCKELHREKKTKIPFGGGNSIWSYCAAAEIRI